VGQRVSRRGKPVNPEAFAAFTVGLDYQWIAFSGNIVRRIVQLASRWYTLLVLPMKDFDMSKRELRKLWIQIQQDDSLLRLWVGRHKFGRGVDSFVQGHGERKCRFRRGLAKFHNFPSSIQLPELEHYSSG